MEVGVLHIEGPYTARTAQGAELLMSVVTVPFTADGEQWYCSEIRSVLTPSRSGAELWQKSQIIYSLSEMVERGH